MNGKIAILVPSRGRPRTFLRLLESAYRHGTPELFDMIVRNGETDPTKEQYRGFEEMPSVIRVVGPDTGFQTNYDGTAGYCVAQQDLWERFPDYSAYLCIEDDCTFETKGFDRWLLKRLKKFPNRIGVIQLVDDARQKQCTCFSAEWCRALGFLHPPEIGEIAFKLPIILGTPNLFAHGDGAHIMHRPLWDGYTGPDRMNLIETDPDRRPLERYFAQEDYFNRWLPSAEMPLRKKLEAAAYGTP